MHFEAGLKDKSYLDPITTPKGLRYRLTEVVQEEKDYYQCWTLENKGNMKVLSLLTVLRSQLLTVLRKISISISLGRIRAGWKCFSDVKTELLVSQNNEITIMFVQAYLAGFKPFLCKHFCFFQPNFHNCWSREWRETFYYICRH